MRKTGEEIPSLDDSGWLPAHVPGVLHLDLMASGQIPDPFFRTNELEVRWIENEDWLYARRFEVPADWEKAASVELHCDGLDTFAEVMRSLSAFGPLLLKQNAWLKSLQSCQAVVFKARTGSACAKICGVCGEDFCPSHLQACPICKLPACQDDLRICSECGRQACKNDVADCPSCDHAACAQHGRICQFCGQPVCEKCFGPSGYCRMGPDLFPATTAAPAIQQILPGPFRKIAGDVEFPLCQIPPCLP